MNSVPGQVEQLLKAIEQGDQAASEQLFPLVYDELRAIAANFMKSERQNHTLQPTALIHEAYLRLTDNDRDKDSEPSQRQFEGVDHFVATAAVVMRRILVNHAKARNAQKREGGKQRLQLESIVETFAERSVDLVALDDALNQLQELDPVQHRLVELKFFGGMSTEQAASVLEISERKAYYEWAHAKAWLQTQIKDE